MAPAAVSLPMTVRVPVGVADGIEWPSVLEHDLEGRRTGLPRRGPARPAPAGWPRRRRGRRRAPSRRPTPRPVGGTEPCAPRSTAAPTPVEHRGPSPPRRSGSRYPGRRVGWSTARPGGLGWRHRPGPPGRQRVHPAGRTPPPGNPPRDPGPADRRTPGRGCRSAWRSRGGGGSRGRARWWPGGSARSPRPDSRRWPGDPSSGSPGSAATSTGMTTCSLQVRW